MAKALASVLPAASAERPDAEDRRDAEGRRLDIADFPGCEEVRIPRNEFEGYEGRVEYWDSRTEIAMVVCEASVFHERPSQRLARLVERIGASRGSIIETFGTCDLVRVVADGDQRVLMEADQVLYLNPPTEAELNYRIDVDNDRLPDVVLEVDYSTDARRGKLPRYEGWGFPEFWIDVPDKRSASRPKARLPGLTIYLLKEGRYHEVTESRAFPGWTAAKIHRALNEHTISEETCAVLDRVGRTLGALDGTGPDDDPWLRRQRDESRREGRHEGFVAATFALLENRGIPFTEELRSRLHRAAARSPEDLIEATQVCTDAEDLAKRLRL